jgi:predicted RNase H-like HicB family nuclease
MKDYHVNVFYSDDDGGYIADIPDLQCCSAFGETPAEALQEVEKAKAAWLAAAKAARKPVPKPRYRPVIYQLAPA